MLEAEKALFAAGCFWGVEAAFRKVKGVTDAAVGYSGGTTEDPTYEAICSGATGHAEVVEVTFDRSRVTFEDLLDVFWDIHDPTTMDRQGPDVGTQYRSAVFFLTSEQEAQARASKERADASARFGGPIVTEITPAGRFHRAEEYHQRYVDKHRRRSGLSGF